MKRRVAACQILTYPDIGKSATKIIRWIKAAAKEKIDAVSFPEGALFGYAGDAAYWASADPAAFKKAERRVRAAAKKLGIAVVLGTAHWEDKRPYNDLLIIDKSGAETGRYSKIHLAEEWSASGKRLPILSVAGVKSCFIICHDVRYPELVRLPAAAGAQICWFSSCESGLTLEYKLSAYRSMPISRAAENGIFLVMANSPADPDNIRGGSQSHGNSKIIGPQGNVIVEAGHFEERLIIADIDTRDATRWVATRAVNDDTILQDWMRNGVKQVEIP